MRDILVLFVHVIVTSVRLLRPGGLRSVVAESALVRHQLLILNRGRKRAHNLYASDRIIAGLFTLLMRPARVLRNGIVLRPSTLMHFHQMLRSVVSIPSVAGQPSGSGGDGSQNHAGCATVAFIRRNNFASYEWGKHCRGLYQTPIAA